jgi:large subunit ribosomal protein L25
MNKELLTISARVPQSKARKLRRQGYIPGVVYGNNHASTPVIFDKKNMENFVNRMGVGMTFEVILDGKTQPVRIQEVQRDPVSQDIIHVDLQSVDMDQKIQARVPLKFEGRQNAERRGLIVQHQKNSIEVEGLAKDIPSHITVPLSMLQNTKAIRVMDLEIADELGIIDRANEIVALSIKPVKEIVTDKEEDTDADDAETEASEEISEMQ